MGMSAHVLVSICRGGDDDLPACELRAAAVCFEYVASIDPKGIWTNLHLSAVRAISQQQRRQRRLEWCQNRITIALRICALPRAAIRNLPHRGDELWLRQSIKRPHPGTR